ncbi:hypothetical protein HNP84_000920 [Thermocatellispora tengchongensis]|uniref:Uncharacterized protein n=1 Tax=Thermocatellispora tengchongensis TaxID=1073253 RepID=A0A840NRG0_9ACTN|nr:hypothetical protein [Thermocatellispora tengchongensis]MBB5131214.1 hypothetical protein [Thermocatellispora tengchongensis]
MTLPRAMAVMGMDWLCDRLSRLSVSRWDHLPFTEIVPALQVHAPDPALPGHSDQVRAAIGGLGGWARARRLTPADFTSASSEAAIGALFREVLARIPAHRSATASATAAPAPASPVPASAAAPASPVPAAPAPAAPPLPTRPQPGVPAAPAAQHPQAAQPAATGAHAPRPAPATPPPAPDLSEHPLVGLVDGMFREWQPLEQAVAIERLFATDPISLRTLAHRLDVDREVLSLAQRSAEERVLLWLRSPASSPLTGHLFRLTEWLGAAATEEQLIGADPAHPVIVPILRTPLWRVLVTLMPDRRLQDGWLVVGDLHALRERTRQLIASKPADADVVDLLGQLGIRSHSAKAWLDALGPVTPGQPPQRQPGGAPASGSYPAQLPRRTPGANGHHRGGTPVPQVNGGAIDPSAALATLSALSGNGAGRPQFMPGQRAGAPSAPPPPPSSHPSNPGSDPRRWQRIEVTSEHLSGAPVAVPEGYAAQLGMRPGTLLSVTGPGDNAVVLVWRDRQPVFDSLQPVLMRLNARPGDQVYVTVDGYRLDAQLPS